MMYEERREVPQSTAKSWTLDRGADPGDRTENAGGGTQSYQHNFFERSCLPGYSHPRKQYSVPMYEYKTTKGSPRNGRMQVAQNGRLAMDQIQIGSRVGVFSWASPPYALPRTILLQFVSLLSFFVILSLVWSLPQYGTDSRGGAVGDRKRISTSRDGGGGLDEDDSEGPGDGPELATASWSQVGWTGSLISSPCHVCDFRCMPV